MTCVEPQTPFENVSGGDWVVVELPFQTNWDVMVLSALAGDQVRRGVLMLAITLAWLPAVIRSARSQSYVWLIALVLVPPLAVPYWLVTLLQNAFAGTRGR